MRILVFGGRGALGSKLLSYCKQKGEWIIAAGFQSSSDANENVVLTNRDSFMAQSAEVYVFLKSHCKFMELL